MLFSLLNHYLVLYKSDTVLKVSQSLYCFTTSICHGVENYFPRLWGVGITDAIFIVLSYLKGASPPPSKLTFLTLISVLFTSCRVLLCAHYVSLKPLYLLTPFHFFTIFTLCTSAYFSMFDQFEHHVALHFHPLHQ